MRKKIEMRKKKKTLKGVKLFHKNPQFMASIENAAPLCDSLTDSFGKFGHLPHHLEKASFST